MKNKAIRKAMIDADLNQKELANILGLTQAHVCVLLNKYELSEEAQNEIIETIKEKTDE